MQYKLKAYQGIDCAVIKKDENGQSWGIPFDPANTDYQEYLKWVEAGNTPLPADEVSNG